jgi:hypothetical protein
MVKESLARRGVLPWKAGDLSFTETLQLITVDEVATMCIISLGMIWSHFPWSHFPGTVKAGLGAV